MSSNPASSDLGGEAGRVRCLYCGANNFPASASCWQCGRPLKAVPAGTPASGPAFAPPGSVPTTYASSPRASSMSETALANKAAASLGLLFPYVGIPVGIVFLMLDDPRKTQLGWITIGWSVVGSVLNAIALFATLAPLWAILKGMPHGGAPPSLPGIPNMGGDGTGLLWPGWIIGWLLPLHV